jgi:hypothetical protein
MRVALTSRARPSSLLDRDRLHGLRLRIDRCTRAWRESKPPYRYSCPGKRTQVVRWRPVIGTNVRLGLANLAKKKPAHLLLTLLLPQTAPNSLQGQRSGLTYTFTAAQAAKRR